MFPESARQAFNVVPPRQGAIIAQVVDSTARAYDLWSIVLGSDANKSPEDHMWVTIECDTADVYFAFASALTNVASLSTSAKSAGSNSGTTANNLTFDNTQAARLLKDDRHEYRIHRRIDRYLILMTASGTANVRFWASSQAPAGSTGI